MDEPAEPVEHQPRKISVLVVSHNRAGLLRRCLESLEGSEARETMEIVVVDNGSEDGSAGLQEDFPEIRFIPLPRNFGLTKALNIGVRATAGEFILFLHEDTELPPSAVRELAARLEAEPEATAVCPLLVTPEGTPAPQLGDIPPDGTWQPVEEPATEPIAVPYARGAALMIRRFFLTAMRQIDERYGQFGADADLAFQIRRAGKKTLLLPQVRVVHHGGQPDSLKAADLQIGRAAFLGKFGGYFTGLKARIASTLGALAGFRLAEFRYLISGQKIDGSQS